MSQAPTPPSLSDREGAVNRKTGGWAPTTPATANRLRVSLERYQGLIWQAAGISVLSNLLMLTGPLFMLQVYDRVLTSRSVPTLVALFGLVTALFAFYGVFDYLRGRLLTRLGARIQVELDVEVFRTSVRAAQDHDPSRRRLLAVRDLEYLQQWFAGPAPLALLDLPWSPFFFAALFLFHWQLGVLAVGGGLVLCGLAVLNHLRSRQLTDMAKTSSAQAESFERSVRAGAEVATALGMLAVAASRWSRLRDNALTAQVTAADRIGGYGAAIKALRFFLQSAILALGAWLAISGSVTPGVIIAASILMGRALAPLEQVVGQWRTYAQARLAWRNLHALFDASDGPRQLTALPRPTGRLEARNMSVAPPHSPSPILRGLTFSIAPGQAMGVIGPSACGKSTLARALTGLWPVVQGSLRLDGATLDQWELEQLGTHIGYLPQDVSLFAGTVAENIARLEPDPTDEAVIAAAQQARAHDMILALADGYDTRIGPASSGLSGGQRQRIGLARALFGSPALVVLDEPNAHLDAPGEQALVEVICDLKAHGCAVVVMAHRPAAIAACDHLLVLNNGRQRAYGPREEVLRETTVPVTGMAPARGVGR